MAKVRAVLGLAFALLIVIFVFQNLDPVEVRILFWPLPMAKAALIAGTFVLGILTGILLWWARGSSQQSRRKASASPPPASPPPEPPGS